MGSDKTVVNIGTSIFLSIILLTSVITPFPAEASGSCYFFGLICTDNAEAEEVKTNSQNIALLQASLSPDDGLSNESEDITIVDGTSLVSEVIKPVDSKKTADEDQISLYKVRKGDTLPAIAKMYGVSVNTIRWGNDIKGNTIAVDQVLVILPISGIQHSVKSGDTLVSIAKKYKGDLDEILQYNNLTKNAKLAVGDIIVVPNGEVAPVSSGSGSSGSSVGTKAPSYPVYEGYYMRPLIGGIKTQGLHDRYAIDFAAAYGTPILASAEGDVLIARGSGYNGGYGSYVVIKHANGTQTLYGHMSGVLVNTGDHVEQGQTIGKMGNTGRVSGPTGIHLHFEVRGARNPF